ncbi:MAG: ankyrin repeat domain-containing protein [Candidatus Hydrogenedentes bacterium]|nr:ankyrin repeat domain-containing protein [Candidatus Hydrogenedentota bacterium]
MKGIWLHALDESGKTPLDRAFGSGHMALAEMMLRQVREDEKELEKKASPMHRAAYLGLTDAVQSLLRIGGDPTQVDSLNETPLHKAVREGHIATVAALLESCNVNAEGSMGMTPLHWACVTGNKDIVELLLTRGADPNKRDECIDGLTAAEMAEKLGYIEIVDLIRAGASYF